jgi:hypothetical protein
MVMGGSTVTVTLGSHLSGTLATTSVASGTLVLWTAHTSATDLAGNKVNWGHVSTPGPASKERIAMKRTIQVITALALVLALTVAFTASAEAAVVRPYKDGPVVYLNKNETRYVGTTTPALAGALLTRFGPWAVFAGTSIANVADQIIQNRVAAGYCLEVKDWWWQLNPALFSVYVRVYWYHNYYPCH